MEHPTATLISITAGGGSCDDCGQPLTLRRFTVRSPGGETRTLGRRCAAKATGWTIAKLKDAEAEAGRQARAAVHAERHKTLVEEYPSLDGAPVGDIITSDWHWGDDSRWRQFAQNRVESINRQRRRR